VGAGQHEVCGALEGQGIRCWTAQAWHQAIIQAISGARIRVVVFSQHWNASQQVMRPVERAVHGGLAVLPSGSDSYSHRIRWRTSSIHRQHKTHNRESIRLSNRRR